VTANTTRRDATAARETRRGSSATARLSAPLTAAERSWLRGEVDRRRRRLVRMREQLERDLERRVQP
jgi:hypothetical protein